MTDWDPKAERLHGVTPPMLSELGVSVAAACDRLTRNLTGYTVYSDAPDWDGFWLMRLFDAAGRRCPIRLKDFSQIIPPMTEAEKNTLLAKADRLAPRRHRAAEDALHLVTVYTLANGRGEG